MSEYDCYGFKFGYDQAPGLRLTLDAKHVNTNFIALLNELFWDLGTYFYKMSYPQLSTIENQKAVYKQH